MTKKVLVTGGAGFIGNHVCEYYARRGYSVISFDNLSRAKLLHKKSAHTRYNWKYLSQFKNIKQVSGSVNDFEKLKKIARGVDVIIHTAAQTAVTTSVVDPQSDFSTNAIGAFHVLEAARLSPKKPAVVLCSTNKVYGERVNDIPLKKTKTRYQFGLAYARGIPENFGTDLTKHTPYGCSKLTADLYAQDYARLYGLKVGVFRMSCIYGTRQFGVEDQGWVAWFVIAALTKQKVTVYGDGRQVRDILWVEDLVQAFDAFIRSKEKHVVVNMGGGPRNTISLIELMAILKKEGLPVKPKYAGWRPSDQKVYISDTRKAEKLLKWKAKVSPQKGILKLIQWIQKEKNLFQK